jgi:hypothetical protein
MPRNIAVAAVLLVGCGSAPPPTPAYTPRPVVELGRWQVWIAGDLVGHVVQLEIRDPSGPLPYYRVQDLHGRWLGHASMHGRFSRRVPFQDQEQDLGVWPMARGVATLFEASAPAELRPVAVEAVGRPGVAEPRDR